MTMAEQLQANVIKMEERAKKKALKKAEEEAKNGPAKPDLNKMSL
jgi:hypothetical protein